MHQALQEDIITHDRIDPPTPAYWFTTLNADSSNQFFRQKVNETTDYLDERIGAYNTTNETTFSLDDFKVKFLQNNDLREEVFRFIYYLTKIKELIHESEYLGTNEFSSLEMVKIFFDMCLITEKTIENKHPEKGERRLDFIHQILFLCENEILTHEQYERDTIYADIKRDFESTIQAILTNKYDKISVPQIDQDFFIAHQMRNFGAHKIESLSLLMQYIDELSQRLLNTLFHTVEHLY